MYGVGMCLLIWGLALYASAIGHHWAWGFVGLLSIIGLLALAALPDRHGKREVISNFQADATQTVQPGGPVYHCIKCNYILSGSTTGTCPECGQPFNPQDPESMRIASESGGDWFERETVPWTARWSLIFGLLSSIMFCLPCFGVLVPGAGVFCGHHARRVTRGNPRLKGSAGVALAGLIVSYIGLVLSIAMTAFFLIGFLSEI